MNTRYGAAIAITAAFLVLAFAAGCNAPIQGPGEIIKSGGSEGGGSGPIILPGGGGRTTIDLNTNYNAAPGKNGMRIANISGSVEPNIEEITTPNTLGLWEDGKFHIEGFNSNFNGGFQNAGFNEVSVLYFDKSFEGEFKFSARVKVKRVGGVSTGKGVHFGAYSNMGRTDDAGDIYWQYGQGSKGFGMFFRAEASPQFRLYYSDGGYNPSGQPIGSSTTAGTGAFGNTGNLLSALAIGKEYIYEVARVMITPAPGAPPTSGNDTNDGKPNWDSEMQYTYKILDSKTGVPVFSSTRVITNAVTGASVDRSLPINSAAHPWGTPVEMHDSLKRAVYPGVCISGSSMEISQIKVWDRGDAVWDYTGGDRLADDGTVTGTGDKPLFWTPETIPAYVPAQNYAPLGAEPGGAGGVLPSTNPYNFYDTNVIIFYSRDLNILYETPYNGSITIIPSVIPAWAEDTIFFEFYYMGLVPYTDGIITIPSVYPAFNIAGDENTAVSVAGVEGKTYGKGIISVETAGMVPGQKTVGKFKIVARDLTLDAQKNADDYSLLQTLPEYYFLVEINR